MGGAERTHIHRPTAMPDHMADVQIPKPEDLGEHRLTKFEGVLRASLPDWWSKITGIRNGIRNRARADIKPPIDEQFDEWEKTLTRVLEEMGSAATNLKTIQDDLNAARSEVAYRKSLVDAWPSGSLWDKMSYIAITLFGAGGAAFYFAAANLSSNPYWPVPAGVLWVVGGALLVISLRGLGKADRKRFDFFSYQFEIPEKFRP